MIQKAKAVQDCPFEEIRVAVVSNMTFGPYLESFLTIYFRDSGRKAVICLIPYEAVRTPASSTLLNQAEYTLVWLNLGLLYPDFFYMEAVDTVFADLMKQFADFSAYLQETVSGRQLWISFEDYDSGLEQTQGFLYDMHQRTGQLNDKLRQQLPEGSVFLDLPHLIALAGISNAYDFRGKYRWGCVYSKALLEEVAKAAVKQYCIDAGISPKCLVLDCDHVLWGGILEEDGIAGIQLGGMGIGQTHQSFQRYVSYLHRQGVILAVCSKNHWEDVLEVFSSHTGMILKAGDISCFQVNWENKADNIIRIANTLNIGLDSIVFVDDSLSEIETVRSALPEVKAILYEPHSIYQNLSCFHLGALQGDSCQNRKRQMTYQTNRERAQLQLCYDSQEAYIQALEMQVSIHPITSGEYGRVSELSQRTNQCTNGKRYTIAELKLEIAAGCQFYTLSLADKFSDLGLVGAMGVKNGRLELFCLSCRAFGRGLEQRMLAYLQTRQSPEGFLFYDTGKNAAVRQLLQDTLSKNINENSQID